MILPLTRKHSFDAVFDSQGMFRLLLEAMSNPTRIMNVSEYADRFQCDHPLLMASAATLLDNEVSFNACEDQPLSDEIASLTLAKLRGIGEADYIFVTDPRRLERAVSGAKGGTPDNPNRSATIIFRNVGGHAGQMRFSGPGIRGTATVQATRTMLDAVTARDSRGLEYPEGIDMIFITDGGRMLALPRHAKAVA